MGGREWAESAEFVILVYREAAAAFRRAGGPWLVPKDFVIDTEELRAKPRL